VESHNTLANTASARTFTVRPPASRGAHAVSGAKGSHFDHIAPHFPVRWGGQVGLNKFSDWSEDEITQLMGDRVDSAVEAQLRPFDLSSLSGGSPPASVDYRDGNNSFGKPGLTPIKVGRSSRMRPGVCLTVVDTEMRPWRVVDAHDWWSYRIRSRAARAGLSRRWRWWRARFYLRRTRSRTSASSSSTSKSDLYCRIVALPLVVRGFGMQHQVIRCAFLPGFDG
jgi:hypothetical protein